MKKCRQYIISRASAGISIKLHVCSVFFGFFDESCQINFKQTYDLIYSVHPHLYLPLSANESKKRMELFCTFLFRSLTKNCIKKWGWSFPSLIFIYYDINPILHQTCEVRLEMDYSTPGNHLFHCNHPNALGNRALEKPTRPTYICHRELSSRGKSSNADKMSSRKHLNLFFSSGWWIILVHKFLMFF